MYELFTLSFPFLCVLGISHPCPPLPQGIVKAPGLELARVATCVVSSHAFPVFL